MVIQLAYLPELFVEVRKSKSSTINNYLNLPLWDGLFDVYTGIAGNCVMLIKSFLFCIMWPLFETLSRSVDNDYYHFIDVPCIFL